MKARFLGRPARETGSLSHGIHRLLFIVLAPLLCLPASIDSASASANLLTFDDVTTWPDDPAVGMPTDYGGVAWSYDGWGVMNPLEFAAWSGIVPPGGYENGLVSGPNVAYGDSGLDPIETTISSLSPLGFDLGEGYFTAAWNNKLQLTVTAISENLTQKSKTFTISTKKPSKLVFNWNNLMSVTFTTNGGVSAGYGGFGTEFVMDNLLLSDVPEPSTWAMTLTGFAGLGFARYWRARTVAAQGTA